jgi:hypothetical protein
MAQSATKARSWRWAAVMKALNDNRRVVTAASGFFAFGVSVAYYCHESAQFVQHVKDVRTSNDLSRWGYVHQRTQTFNAYMPKVKKAVDDARNALRQPPLRYWRFPALLAANLSNVEELEHLAAHTYYHFAVLRMHGHYMDEALALLDESAAIRKAVSTSLSTGTAGRAERARAITSRGDMTSWGSVSDARKAYLDIIKEEEQRPRFFSVRALNNFAWLWYALGYDADAIDHFRCSAARADELSGAAPDKVDGMAASAAVLSGLRKLGDGQATPKSTLPQEVMDVINAAECGVVDVDHVLIGTADGTYELEQVGRLKLTWRKRITTRVNLLHVYITTTTPMPNQVQDALLGCATLPWVGNRTLLPRFTSRICTSTTTGSTAVGCNASPRGLGAR